MSGNCEFIFKEFVQAPFLNFKFTYFGTFQQKLIVTAQMLLKSKCLDMLVLHNECG